MTVDLALAKLHLRVRHDDEDVLLEQYIAASALLIEKMAGVLLTRREVSQQFSAFCTRLPLFWGPNPDDLAVAYLDAASAPQTIADVRIVREWFYAPGSGWPSIATNSVIEVTYTAGFDEAPADLVSAVLLLVGHYYNAREAAAEKAMTEVPLAVDALVQPYRRVFV